MTEHPFRLLLVGPAPPPLHGVSAFVRELAATGLGADVQMRWVDTSDHRSADNLGRWDAVNLYSGLRSLAEIAWQCLRFRPDLVYLPLSQNTPACLRDALFVLQTRLLGSSAVLHLHGGGFRRFFDQSSAWFRVWMRFTLRRSSGVFVLGECFRPIFDQLLPPDRIWVTPNGVLDPGAWELRAQQPFQAPPADGGVVVCLGTLHRDKGLFTLLDAAEIMVGRRKRFRLRLAGPWQDQATRLEFEARRQASFPAGTVEVLPPISGEAKARFLAEADLFCLPTRWPHEGQPLVILEALAAGLPIIAARHAAIPETLGAAPPGALLPADADGRALALVWEEFFSVPERLRLAGETARSLYLQRYTWAACLTRLKAALIAAAQPPMGGGDLN
jgi:glycosyltransferase involved in cell wall biosynthesis